MENLVLFIQRNTPGSRAAGSVGNKPSNIFLHSLRHAGPPHTGIRRHKTQTSTSCRKHVCLKSSYPDYKKYQILQNVSRIFALSWQHEAVCACVWRGRLSITVTKDTQKTRQRDPSWCDDINKYVPAEGGGSRIHSTSLWLAAQTSTGLLFTFETQQRGHESDSA